MNDTLAGLSFLLLLIVIGICIPVAFALEKRLKARLPHTRPYKWGFYIGCMDVACSPFALLLLGATPFVNSSNEVMGCLLLGGWFLFHTVCGVFIIRRNRWAWLLGTIFSFNIVGWIVNGIYLSNRWKEMKEETLGTLPSSHSEPVTAPLARERDHTVNVPRGGDERSTPSPSGAQPVGLTAHEASIPAKRFIPTLISSIALSLGALAILFFGLAVIRPAAITAKLKPAAPTNSPVETIVEDPGDLVPVGTPVAPANPSAAPLSQQPSKNSSRGGRVMWTAFQCATYAELAGMKDQQRRLFELGYREGKIFLQALSTGEAKREDAPVGVLWRLGGPSIDFMIGHVFAGATEDAFDQVVKQSADGTSINDPLRWADGELKVLRAEQKFERSNCALLE